MKKEEKAMKSKRTIEVFSYFTTLMMLLVSCTNANSNVTRQSSIYIIDNNDSDNSLVSEHSIKWTADVSKYNSVGNDSLRLISHTRNTGVVFNEGQKFLFPIGNATREFEYHSNDSGEVFEVVFSDADGTVCELSVNKNGDLIRFIKGNKQQDNELFLSDSELYDKAMEYLKLYNKNLLTGNRIVELDDYKTTQQLNYSGYYYLWMVQNDINGWHTDSRIILFIRQNGELDRIQITKPGYIYDSEVPAMPERAVLDCKLSDMLKNYSSGYDNIEIDYYSDEFGRSSPVLMYDEYGRLGIEVRVLFLKESKIIDSTSVYVPFESLDLCG